MTGGDAERRVEERVEKRGNARAPSRRPVRLRLAAAELVGLMRDQSDGGVFVLSAQDLEVACAIEGEETARRARVVRIEPLPGGGVGFALEFIE